MNSRMKISCLLLTPVMDQAQSGGINMPKLPTKPQGDTCEEEEEEEVCKDPGSAYHSYRWCHP